MYRSRLFTVVTIAGVLAFGTAALSTCTPAMTPIDPTTTTVQVTTTTAPRVVGDPSEEMISVTPSGAAASYPPPSGEYSASAAMTPDGRYVAFASSATDLVPGDTNGL